MAVLKKNMRLCPQITQRGPSRNQSDTIHEPTRNNTNQVSCDLNFVLVRVISWIVLFRQNLVQKPRSFAIASQRNQHGSTFRAKPVAFLLASSLMTSCSRAPSFDILGSYFPAWLICLALGVVLTAVIRWLMLRLKIDFVFPIVVYPSLTALIAFGMWLVFYG